MQFQLSAERRLCLRGMEGSPSFGRTRFGATLAVAKNDLIEGIRGDDPVDVLRIVRNTGAAAWHLLQGAIPSIANAFNGQRYTVRRRQGPFDATGNSAKKVFQTKGIIGKASAVLAELTDGPVDDALHAVGGAEWLIVPERTSGSIRHQLASTLNRRSEEPHFTHAA